MFYRVWLLVVIIYPRIALAEMPVIDPSVLAETVKNGSNLSSILTKAESMAYNLAEIEQAFTGETGMAQKVLGKVSNLRNKTYSMRSSLPYIPELEGSVFRGGRVLFDSKDKIFDMYNKHIYRTMPNDPYGRNTYQIRKEHEQNSYIVAMVESDEVITNAEEDVSVLTTLSARAKVATTPKERNAVLLEMQATELAFLQEIKTLLANLVKATAVQNAKGVIRSSSDDKYVQFEKGKSNSKYDEEPICTNFAREKGFC